MHEEEADPYLSDSDREDIDLEEHGVANSDDDGEGDGGRISIPCTGGCVYNEWNYRNGSAQTRKKINAHRRLFDRLWINAVEVMEHCNKVGAMAILEWPTNNLYWKLPKVVKYFSRTFPTENGITGSWQPVRIHGCAYGLRSKDNRPIKKPWTLMTNMSKTVEQMQRRCVCYKAQPGAPPVLRRGEKHTKCAGRETKPSENYPKSLADEFHIMFANHCLGNGNGCKT